MNETNCKATNIAKEMFNKYHKSRSHMCYSKCRDEIIEALQERKLSKYVTVEILNKMIQYIKNCKICIQNNLLKKKKKLKTCPKTVFKIVYADLALIEDRYVLFLINGFSKYL